MERTKTKTKEKATAKKFYDMKIREWGRNGYSRYLNVSKLLPKSWKYVRVYPRKFNEKNWILSVECLLKEEEAKSNERMA